ncbi:MAG: PD-(D/E)XK nuclease family protein [Flavobacteriaceae bacterium]|nr:PD-(D/E)XK nuclease family protein [Flavobacteriaceae bacterium]
MQTFISDTISAILSKQTTFENTVMVLPSQRAGVFVKQELKEKITVGFLPEILNIESFTESISGIKKADTVQLLFSFYSVYRKIEKEPEAFDTFFNWATTVLQDFNEIDQHLVNPTELFIYLRDIERLKKWSVKKPLVETKLMKNHYSFIEKLGEYYTAFYNFLLSKHIGYQGLIYREATKKVTSFIEKNKHKNFIFLGFNALNKAEEYIFQQLLAAENTAIYWDIDETFLQSKHQAGNFIRKYNAEWKYYLTHELKTISNHFQEEKNIHIIGASKNTTQIKYAGEILNTLSNYTHTAFVMADESLLPLTLNSLPKKVEAINITMGYPLKDIPITSLFTTIFQLFLTQDRLEKTSVQQFYFKEVLQFFKHSTIQGLLLVNKRNIFDSIAVQIARDNDAFISFFQLETFLSPLPQNIQDTLLSIFKPYKDALEFFSRLLQLITVVKETANTIEKEYFFRYYTIFTQLQTLQLEHKYVNSLKTIAQLFQQLIQSENIAFQGEPLQGLQLMGMLETRMLDFENVIITSVNEHILPKSSSQNSFIPFDVKLDVGLPTYKEKDAIFSYHFFRLLQRAKNIYLLYNSENDTFGGGEKSRFITQLQHLKPQAKEQLVAPKVITEKAEPKSIEKTPAIIDSLKVQATKGFSPSTLTNYLYNPYSFYQQKILGIKEYKEVEETVAYNTMGTIIHDTLDVLYQPLIGVFLTIENIKAMFDKVDELVAYYFKKHFHSNDVYTGKNRLIFEVSKNYINRFLESELELLKNKNALKIIATEQDLATEITIDGFDFPINIHGQVDRIDELNGVTRIIDYKTGFVQESNLKVNDISLIADEKYSKAIQVLLYAFLYMKNTKNTRPIEAGIISFKNLNSGLLKVSFDKNEYAITEERITMFINEVKEIIKEIFDVSVPFIEKRH